MRRSIIHVALVVKDYDEAIAFYTNLWDLIQLAPGHPIARRLAAE